LTIQIGEARIFHRSTEVSDLRLPPRINGGIRDGSSFFVHPNDAEARGRGLVLAKHTQCPFGKSTFDQTTGILKDVFHDENGEHNDPPEYISIPRTLPIECEACRVMLDSYSSVSLTL
jgi:hypothetical protein